MTYAELYRKSVLLANEIDIRDETGEGYCIVLAQENEKFIRAFWGIMLAGRKTVISPLLTELTDIVEMIKKQIISLKNCYIVTTSKFMPIVSNILNSNRIINVDEFSDVPDTVSEREYIGKFSNDISMIQYSSGSMSHPKGVKITDYNILTNVYQVLSRLKFTEKDSAINYLPLNHALGLIALNVAPMFLEIEQYHIETKSMLQNPLLLLDKIDEYRITATASPNIGLKYTLEAMKIAEHRNWDLSCVRVFILGAEPLSWKLISGFGSAMQVYGMRWDSIYTAYGMTEAVLAISIPEAGDKPSCVYLNNTTMPGLAEKVDVVSFENNIDKEIRSSVSLGFPVEGVELRICDGNGNLCQEGFAGEIQIKGPNVFQGYVQGDEKDFTEDRWFRTGDIGTQIDGKLYVFGRLKNMLVANGSNLYLEDIEACLTKNLKIQVGSVAVTKSEELNADNTISIYFEKGAFEEKVFETIIDESKNIVQSTFGIEVKSVSIVESLPRTSVGKIARGKMAHVNVIREIEIDKGTDTSKQLSEKIIRGTKEEIKETLIKLIKQETGVEINDPEMGFLDAGLDSLKLNLLIEILKKDYPQIKISDLFEASNVNKLSDMLIGFNSTHKVESKSMTKKDAPYAVLFPGQGALNKESCETLYRSFDVARKTFDEASKILGHDIVNDFKQGQPELVAASIAAYRVLESYIGIAPKYMAGHSLGEYSALCAANILDFETVLKLTQIREKLMKSANSGIMAAILGLDQSYVQSYIDEQMKGENVYCANYNSPKQIVISGDELSVKKAMKELEAKGASVVQLRTDSASHCPLMSNVAIQFRRELENVTYKMDSSEIQVLADVNAERYTQNNIIDNLANQLTNPVLWSQIVKIMNDQGINTYIDAGPGEILKKLNGYMGFNNTVRSYSVEFDLDDIKGLFKKSNTSIQKDDIGELLKSCIRVVIGTPCKKDYSKDMYDNLIANPINKIVNDYKMFQETGKLSKEVNYSELLRNTLRIMENKGFSESYAMELLEQTS